MEANPARPRAFADLLRLHKAAGSGAEAERAWRWDDLEEPKSSWGASGRSIRTYVDGGRPSQLKFDVLATTLKLDPGLSPFPGVDAAKVSCMRAELEAAFHNALQKTTGNEALYVPWAPPAGLPASINGRTQEVLGQVRSLLEQGAGPSAHGPLVALEAEWKEGVKALQANRNADDPLRLLIELSRCVDRCNRGMQPWRNRLRTQADPLALAGHRRELVTRLAKLLFTLLWTEEAWVSLANWSAGSRVVATVSEPRLLQAGIDAAHGRDFDLPTRVRKTSLPRPARTRGRPIPDEWHLELGGAVYGGAGPDELSRCLVELADLLGLDARSTQRVPKEDESRWLGRLHAFARRMGDEIGAIRTFADDRSFVVSELMPTLDQAALRRLWVLAEYLQSLPVAYDGQPGSPGLLRVPEAGVLRALDICVDQISAIGLEAP